MLLMQVKSPVEQSFSYISCTHAFSLARQSMQARRSFDAFPLQGGDGNVWVIHDKWQNMEEGRGWRKPLARNHGCKQSLLLICFISRFLAPRVAWKSIWSASMRDVSISSPVRGWLLEWRREWEYRRPPFAEVLKETETAIFSVITSDAAAKCWIFFFK